MDGLLGRRNDWEKPLVHVLRQASSGEGGRIAERLHHDTSNYLIRRIDAENYDRMHANLATGFGHRDGQRRIVEVGRLRKHNIATRIGRSSHSEMLIEWLGCKKWRSVQV